MFRGFTRRSLGKTFEPVGDLMSRTQKADALRTELGSRAVFKRTVRDAAYLFIDTWREVKIAHKSYNDFYDYIKARGKGKNLSEERMDSLDLELMRKQLNLYHTTKSPLTSFRLTNFYWMYAIWFLILLQGGWQAYGRKQAYIEMLGSDAADMTIEERRKRFGGGYIEDVRGQ
jgi:hypothetical protein